MSKTTEIENTYEQLVRGSIEEPAQDMQDEQINHQNPFKLDKDLDFDRIAEDKVLAKEAQRMKLLKSESALDSTYLYKNQRPPRAGKVWDFNGKSEERRMSTERRKDNLMHTGQNIITKGRQVGRENLVKTIQNKREIGLIKMMLNDKKNVIAQMDQSQKEREDGLQDSERLLEADLKKFMDCFQNLKFNKSKEKEKNTELSKEQDRLKQQHDAMESQQNLLEQEHNQIKSTLRDLDEQKRKILSLMQEDKYEQASSKEVELKEDEFKNKIDKFRETIIEMTDNIQNLSDRIGQLELEKAKLLRENEEEDQKRQVKKNKADLRTAGTADVKDNRDNVRTKLMANRKHVNEKLHEIIKKNIEKENSQDEKFKEKPNLMIEKIEDWLQESEKMLADYNGMNNANIPNPIKIIKNFDFEDADKDKANAKKSRKSDMPKDQRKPLIETNKKLMQKSLLNREDKKKGKLEDKDMVEKDDLTLQLEPDDK